MKSFKFALVLLILLISIPVVAQRYSFNAYYFVAAIGDEIIDKDEVDIDMTLNFDTQRLMIYSKETQIIDFEALRTYEDEDGYQVLEATATDTNWKNIMLKILVSSEKKSIIIVIAYPDYAYSYICRII